MNKKIIHNFVITTFVSLYLIVSFFSTYHVISFFHLSNPLWASVGLAIAFEVGAGASLASLTILHKLNKTLVISLFIMLTLMQMMSNMYYAYTNAGDISGWAELFFLSEEPILYQKQIFAFISGGILPLIALGFIKSLMDYIKPAEETDVEETEVKETEVEETDVEETEVEETEVEETDVEETEVEETEVEETEVKETDVEETDVEETDVEETDVEETQQVSDGYVKDHVPHVHTIPGIHKK